MPLVALSICFHRSETASVPSAGAEAARRKSSRASSEAAIGAAIGAASWNGSRPCRVSTGRRAVRLVRRGSGRTVVHDADILRVEVAVAGEAGGVQRRSEGRYTTVRSAAKRLRAVSCQWLLRVLRGGQRGRRGEVEQP